MTSPFAPLRKTLAALALALALLCALPALAAAQSSDAPPPAAAPTPFVPPEEGHYKACHGYVRHVSDLNLRVHCIDGAASDQSFLYLPSYTNLRDGKSLQTKALLPDTPVLIYYTQTAGVKHAHMIYLLDPNGNGANGFRS
jgi:hypothetical protein